MSDLLTKEKQFVKLNQQLDRMAVIADSGKEAASTKTENKFYTYQKSKGPSTLLKKQGAGDGFVEIGSVSPRKYPNYKVMEEESYRASNKQPSTSHGQSTISSNLTQNRAKQTKVTDSNRSQAYRTSNSHIVPSNNTTFTVKYRNPKFLESPSLEVLVKEESSLLRNQSESMRINNLNSMPVEDNNSTGCFPSNNFMVASKKNISSEGLIKFLKSKIVIVEEDHERISKEMAKQKELLEKALEHTKTLEQQRDQAKAKNTALTEQLNKTEKQLEEANKRLKERNVEYNAQQKELETTKRDLKLLKQTNVNLEKRLFKANEDLESARNTLNLVKKNEREEKETTRKATESKEMQIKSLQKQRANLLNAYKKQLFLIDNLKRQNVLLEQAKMLDFGEKEFAKVLDWDIKS